MKIIYDANKPLIASEITLRMEGLTINTVQAMLKKLLAREVIEVADIVYSGTVLSRSYRLTSKAPKLVAKELLKEVKKYDGFVDYNYLIKELEKIEEK